MKSIRLVREGKVYDTDKYQPLVREYLEYSHPVIASQRSGFGTVSLLTTGAVVFSHDSYSGSLLNKPIVILENELPVIDVDIIDREIHILTCDGKLHLYSYSRDFCRVSTQERMIAKLSLFNSICCLSVEGEIFQYIQGTLTKLTGNLLCSYWLKGSFLHLFNDGRLSLERDTSIPYSTAIKVEPTYSLLENTAIVLDDKGDLYKINSQETKLLLSQVKDFEVSYAEIYALGKDNKFRMLRMKDGDTPSDIIEINV